MSTKPNTHPFDRLASLYEAFAEDVTDEALAACLGAPQGLDASDPADAAMLAGMPDASLHSASALRYLALLDLNQEPDLSPDAPVYEVPDAAHISALLEREIHCLHETFKERPSLVSHGAWREAFELFLAYRDKFADPEFVLLLPKRLS